MGVTNSALRRDRFTYARNLFNEICAGCHSLADAGAHGKRFNLDNDPLLSRALVYQAIKFGEFGMPRWSDVLSEREIAALAGYVDAVAARRNGETGWGAETKRRQEGEPLERRNQLRGKPGS
ncbi:MAG: cytochrome c [Bradyrhizobium sp.]